MSGSSAASPERATSSVTSRPARGWPRQLQPVDPAEFAIHLADRTDAGPAGGVTEVGGPRRASFGEFAARWHRAHGRPGRVREAPVPGRASAAFRAGAQCPAPDAPVGRVSFAEWAAAHRPLLMARDVGV